MSHIGWKTLWHEQKLSSAIEAPPANTVEMGANSVPRGCLEIVGFDTKCVWTRQA
jgi:hypothetical protein